MRKQKPLKKYLVRNPTACTGKFDERNFTLAERYQVKNKERKF